MLEVQGLTKLYAGIPAVENVSFRLEAGQVLGYLGPNGSGKSTTANMLVGLLEPTRGQILFDGQEVRGDLRAYRARLGYVPELAHLYQHLSAREYLELVGRLRDLTEETMRRRGDDLLELFGLTPFRDSVLASYSKGMQQKVLICSALLHNPDLLIFDEPLSGLDVGAVLIFRHLVAALAQEGKTILYSSHVLDAVEKVCTDVLILRRGKVVAQGSVAELRSATNMSSLENVFATLVLEQDSEQIARQVVAAMA